MREFFFGWIVPFAFVGTFIAGITVIVLVIDDVHTKHATALCQSRGGVYHCGSGGCDCYRHDGTVMLEER